MPYRRTSNPGSEPLTLAEAKAHLRVEHSAEDALITALITAARELCEARCQRALIDQAWMLTLDNFPSAIRLRYGRVTSITSIRYVDTSGAQQTLAAPDYVLDNSSDYVQWVVPAAGAAWPDTPTDRVNNVEVVYRAGAATAADVPAAVKQWILLTVGALYRQREAGVERAVTTLPRDFCDGLLDVHRVMEV